MITSSRAWPGGVLTVWTNLPFCGRIFKIAPHYYSQFWSSPGLYLLAWPYTIKSPNSSNFFTLHYYISHRAQADLLSHKDLDMALTGAMMAFTNNREHITNGGHTVEERQRAHTTYMHNGRKVCQQTLDSFTGSARRDCWH